MHSYLGRCIGTRVAVYMKVRAHNAYIFNAANLQELIFEF